MFKVRVNKGLQEGTGHFCLPLALNCAIIFNRNVKIIQDIKFLVFMLNPDTVKALKKFKIKINAFKYF